MRVRPAHDEEVSQFLEGFCARAFRDFSWATKELEEVITQLRWHDGERESSLRVGLDRAAHGFADAEKLRAHALDAIREGRTREGFESARLVCAESSRHINDLEKAGRELLRYLEAQGQDAAVARAKPVAAKVARLSAMWMPLQKRASGVAKAYARVREDGTHMESSHAITSRFTIGKSDVTISAFMRVYERDILVENAFVPLAEFLLTLAQRVPNSKYAKMCEAAAKRKSGMEALLRLCMRFIVGIVEDILRRNASLLIASKTHIYVNLDDDSGYADYAHNRSSPSTVLLGLRPEIALVDFIAHLPERRNQCRSYEYILHELTHWWHMFLNRRAKDAAANAMRIAGPEISSRTLELFDSLYFMYIECIAQLSAHTRGLWIDRKENLSDVESAIRALRVAYSLAPEERPDALLKLCKESPFRYGFSYWAGILILVHDHDSVLSIVHVAPEGQTLVKKDQVRHLPLSTDKEAFRFGVLPERAAQFAQAMKRIALLDTAGFFEAYWSACEALDVQPVLTRERLVAFNEETLRQERQELAKRGFVEEDTKHAGLKELWSRIFRQRE